MPIPILAMMLCVFGVGTAEYVVTGVLAGITSDLDVSIPAAGWLVTAYAVTVVVGGPLLTVLTVRLPRRPLMLGLLGLFALGNLLAALAPNFGFLLVARVISALPHATFFALCIVAASSMVTPDKQGRALANVALGLNLATVLGVPIGTYIGTATNWRGTFAAVAVYGIAAAVLLAATVKLPASEAPGEIRSELRVFGNRNVIAAIAVTALGQAGVFIVFTYITPLLTDVARFEVGSVAPLLLVFGVGSIVGNQVGGRLADRAGTAGLVGLLGALVAGLVVLWAALSNAGATAVMLFVFGAAAFSIIPGLTMRLLGAAASAPNLAATVNIAGFQVANALGAWIGGLVVATSLGLASLPLVGAGVALLGLLVALSMWRAEERGRDVSDSEPADAAVGE